MIQNEPKTLYVAFSDNEIRKHAETSVRTLRDHRFPQLRFRYSSTNRARGSWHVVIGDAWGKAGSFPGINAKTMQATLPAILARRAIDPKAGSTVSSWKTVGQVLTWYADRMARDRGLSDKRKASAKSALRCHLQPKLDGLALADLDHSNLDHLLLWPMQEAHALSFVRSVYGVLAVAFRQAFTLKLIASNPMASLKFGDFVKTRIKPKPARLRADDIQPLLTLLTDQQEREPIRSMLALMMLTHGTRLGESRLSRWKNINLVTRQWFIPAEDTKTKHEHTLPLTEQACMMLRRYRDDQAARGSLGVYVFPGTPSRCLSANKASTLFRVLSGGLWSSHDLRKVARTAWMDLGVDYMVGELLVNHAMKDLDATYIHTTAEDLKRKALQTWHQWLDGQGFAVLHGGTFPRQGFAADTVEAAYSEGLDGSEVPSQRRTRIVQEDAK